MRRLIGLLLLIFVPLTTMAQNRYPIHEDFRAACRITAPLGRGVLGIGNAFLAAMPKGMHSDSELTINKIEIVSTADGEEFDCLRDEGNEFARLLQNECVATTHTQTKSTMHGFDMAQRSEITEHQITARCKWLMEW